MEQDHWEAASNCCLHTLQDIWKERMLDSLAHGPFLGLDHVLFHCCFGQSHAASEIASLKTVNDELIM
ncbi:hypothetical protein CKAN_00309600 [Cinnamomum micranthum f. kanehirae]|uniref:Uncharacterized protein n=1 Tax=Cinnamomum micranthum f. kanehirae TaxID=337451 RepID=A0A443N8C2_9MAGN|nr:hypothetical protein CKAN_00309600 [Cinnamomum micranthum f. kanehirae]